MCILHNFRLKIYVLVDLSVEYALGHKQNQSIRYLNYKTKWGNRVITDVTTYFGHNQHSYICP